MFMPTARFMRSMAVDKRCPGGGEHYLGAMESENTGICGRCLEIAFPGPMAKDPEMLRFRLEESQVLSLSISAD